VNHETVISLPVPVCSFGIAVFASLMFPCTIKSRSSLLAPAHPGGPRKKAVKWFGGGGGAFASFSIGGLKLCIFLSGYYSV